MKHTVLTIFIILSSPLRLWAVDGNGLLLRELDKVIAERTYYTEKKQAEIQRLKGRKSQSHNLQEQYNMNLELIHLYESFICDSAEQYIRANIRLAEQMGDKERLMEAKLRLAFVYSLSGLFIQANDIYKSVACATLPNSLKGWYCWGRIRFYENLMRYTDDRRFTHEYTVEKEAYRDTVMGILPKHSDEYRKEEAIKLQERGDASTALTMLHAIYQKQSPDSHDYAMMSMGMAHAYHLLGDEESEERFLIQAAIADVKLGVKENEALLSLAIALYHKGDVNRAYNYIKVVLDDAIFYNSRFKNTVIARIHPIIESTYLYQLEVQRRNLRLYTGLVSLFVVALAVTLCFVYKQGRMVARTKRHLNDLNHKLVNLNRQLDEANLVKEKHIGYFINQCGFYINKLDDYRKNVNRKIKAGQIDDLYKSSSRPFQRELEDLYLNFDRAFLKLYPHFVDEFNALLRPEEAYRLDKDRLNTELRIFALIRLGITDVGQIAVFLHYSAQTIYNYKSKVKRMAIVDSSLFEDEVKKLGMLPTV